MTPLVQTDWLAERLREPDLVVIDASWHMPDAGRDGAREYLAAHIPGAVFFDVDLIADTSSGLPHMLPSPDAFSQAMAGLGIGDSMQAVVYDSLGLFSAPRVWWTLKTFGMGRVRVLDGGLPKWRAEGRPLESGPARRPPASFVAHFNPSAVADTASVLRQTQSGGAQILDARAADRFHGRAAEPRPGLRGGHIPGSKNLPWTEIVRDGRLLDAAALQAAFERIGVDGSKPVITSCGSGLSAAILSLALAMIGRNSALYDGSWTEWGARVDLPVEPANGSNASAATRSRFRR